MRFPVRTAVCLIALAGLSGGCQSEVRSPLGERSIVKGKVLHGGTVLTRGTLVFAPVDAAKGDKQPGYLDPTGEYTTTVFPGKYKVYVIENPAVPARYQSPDTTDVEVDVPAGGKTGLDIELR
jgi:hypothetical protein